MNELGRELMRRAAAIIKECSRLETPALAAHTAVFGMLVIFDGSGESIGTQYRVSTEFGQPVEFLHHELSEFVMYPQRQVLSMTDEALLLIIRLLVALFTRDLFHRGEMDINTQQDHFELMEDAKVFLNAHLPRS